MHFSIDTKLYNISCRIAERKALYHEHAGTGIIPRLMSFHANGVSDSAICSSYTAFFTCRASDSVEVVNASPQASPHASPQAGIIIYYSVRLFYNIELGYKTFSLCTVSHTQTQLISH